MNLEKPFSVSYIGHRWGVKGAGQYFATTEEAIANAKRALEDSMRAEVWRAVNHGQMRLTHTLVWTSA